MAYEVTARARALAAQIEKKPGIVVLIDGISEAFGVQIVQTQARYGENEIVYGQEGLVFGGLTKILESNQLISATGTTSDISQQLDPDKGAASSTQIIKVRMTDFAQKITRLIAPGKVVPDIMYRRCEIYLGFEDSSFPEDYIEIFNGNISEVRPGSGYVDISISHPEEAKRSDIFIRAETVLTEPLNFNSVEIQELFFQAQPDNSTPFQVQYVDGFPFGVDNGEAEVVVAGNLIQVRIDIGETTQRAVRKALQTSVDFADLATVKTKKDGDLGALAVIQGPTSSQTATEIPVENVAEFLLPLGTIFRTYVQIGDEIIQYTGIDVLNSKLTGCTRAALDSLGSIHEEEDEVFSFYRLGDNTFENGNAISLALWILMSGGPQFYLAGEPVSNFVTINLTDSNPQGVFFAGRNLKRKHGLTIGDKITSAGDANPANNFVDRIVENIEVTDEGTIVTVSGAPLAISVDSTAVIAVKSQFNILPDGLGLVPSQVDVDEFLSIQSTFFSSIAVYDLYLKDTHQGKQLINEKIFLPSALYSIPRKGRVSVGMTNPPLFKNGTQELTLETVKNPDKIEISRSLGRNFYNAVVYKYNEDSVEDKFLSGKITLSAESTGRIPAPTRSMKIEAGGLRPGAATALLIDRNTARILGRYQFGAESLQVEVPFKVGWLVEVGDPIVFGSSDLQVSDSTQGTRDFRPRIFEVMNKRYNWRTGKILLEILDTNFNQSVRYGTWAPASRLTAGSTNESLKLLPSYGYRADEREKWEFYLNRQVLVYSPDWSQTFLTRVIGFDQADDTRLLIEPIGAVPTDGWGVRLPKYEALDNDSQIYKSLHPFWCPQLTVVSGSSGTQFTVSPTDVAKAFVGGIVRVRAEDFSVDSGLKPLKITDITGNVITTEPIGFTPSAGHRVDLIGFVSDEGQPYVWL